MLDPQRTPTAMEILVRACLLLLPVLTLVDGSEINLTVKEDDDAILPCSFGTTDITQKTFDWNKEPDKEVFFYQYNSLSGSSRSAQDSQFKHRVDHFPDQLKVGNASIVIRKTKPADSGTYTCKFPREQPQKRAVIHLTVGSFAQPVAKVVKTDEGPMLRCVVKGASPKPEVVWKDSFGNIVDSKESQVSNSTEKKGTYDIVLEAEVTKKDTYQCVATQREIHHEMYDDIYATADDTSKVPPGYSVELVVGLVVGLGVPLVVLAVVFVSFVLYVLKTRSHVTQNSSQSNGPSENSASLQPLTKSA